MMAVGSRVSFLIAEGCPLTSQHDRPDEHRPKKGPPRDSEESWDLSHSAPSPDEWEDPDESGDIPSDLPDLDNLGGISADDLGLPPDLDDGKWDLESEDPIPFSPESEDAPAPPPLDSMSAEGEGTSDSPAPRLDDSFILDLEQSPEAFNGDDLLDELVLLDDSELLGGEGTFKDWMATPALASTGKPAPAPERTPRVPPPVADAVPGEPETELFEPPERDEAADESLAAELAESTSPDLPPASAEDTVFAAEGPSSAAPWDDEEDEAEEEEETDEPKISSEPASDFFGLPTVDSFKPSAPKPARPARSAESEATLEDLFGEAPAASPEDWENEPRPTEDDLAFELPEPTVSAAPGDTSASFAASPASFSKASPRRGPGDSEADHGTFAGDSREAPMLAIETFGDDSEETFATGVEVPLDAGDDEGFLTDGEPLELSSVSSGEFRGSRSIALWKGMAAALLVAASLAAALWFKPWQQFLGQEAAPAVQVATQPTSRPAADPEENRGIDATVPPVGGEPEGTEIDATSAPTGTDPLPLPEPAAGDPAPTPTSGSTAAVVEVIPLDPIDRADPGVLTDDPEGALLEVPSWISEGLLTSTTDPTGTAVSGPDAPTSGESTTALTPSVWKPADPQAGPAEVAVTPQDSLRNQLLLHRGEMVIELQNGHLFRGRFKRLRGDMLTIAEGAKEYSFDLKEVVLMNPDQPEFRSGEDLPKATVTLNNGQRIRGRLLKETADAVVLAFPEGHLRLARKDVRTVSYAGRVHF